MYNIIIEKPSAVPTRNLKRDNNNYLRRFLREHNIETAAIPRRYPTNNSRKFVLAAKSLLPRESYYYIANRLRRRRRRVHGSRAKTTILPAAVVRVRIRSVFCLPRGRVARRPPEKCRETVLQGVREAGLIGVYVYSERSPTHARFQSLKTRPQHTLATAARPW